MAHSTTATSSYSLSKYSRSYPTSAQTYADWQHFTNPEIRLVLDVERGNNSELQGVRLRVLWHMQDGDSQQPQVVFEDIDLLSFSSLATDNSQNSQQQLPLKAVYRDNLVGIRYLHPKESVNAIPTFRRFQVTFASAMIVTEFVNTICSVCPCKFNPAGNGNQNMDPPQIPFQTQPATSTVERAGSVSMSRTTASSLSSPQVPSSSQQEKDYSQFTSSPVERARSCHPRELGREPTMSWTPGYRNRPGPTEQSSRLYLLGSHLSSQDPDVHEYQNSRHISDGNEHISKGSAMETTSALLSAVQETTQLYDLSPAALEQVVARVVHEDGFPQLLETLTKLWGVKSLINSHIPK